MLGVLIQALHTNACLGAGAGLLYSVSGGFMSTLYGKCERPGESVTDISA